MNEQKRLFLAVLLSGVIIAGWQYFFPPAPVITEGKIEESNITENKDTSISDSSVIQQASKAIKNKLIEVKEILTEQVLETHTISNDKVKYEIRSNFNITDVKYPDQTFSFNEIIESENPITINYFNGSKYQKLNFDLVESSKTQMIFKSTSPEVFFSLSLNENGKIKYSIKSDSPALYQIQLNTLKKELENKQLRNFVYLDTELNTVLVGKEQEDETDIQWAGIDFNYHFFGITFSEKTRSTYKATIDGDAQISLVKPTTSLEGSIVFVKKDYDHLVSLGENLKLAVDFGWWGVIAVPILRSLQFFHKYIPNYGLAIIIVTLILRLLTFPLQYKSMKSMKNMQTLQPELNRIKEKFKDDPKRQQQETMELFKRTGYNPVGGCLPMLLQIPVFFAFYKVLYNSVELVGSPFFGWIHDLSNKDPYYVLPVLMAASFFLQQKLTPTPTTDPTQKKVMMFMPVIFLFIMKDLPSGLTLYIFVSTLFGIIQQLFVQRTKNA